MINTRTNCYSASSPDELALVYMSKQYGFEFKNIDSHNNFIVFDKNKNEELKYKLLSTQEFNSTRKRMSVIMENPE